MLYFIHCRSFYFLLFKPTLIDILFSLNTLKTFIKKLGAGSKLKSRISGKYLIKCLRKTNLWKLRMTKYACMQSFFLHIFCYPCKLCKLYMVLLLIEYLPLVNSTTLHSLANISFSFSLWKFRLSGIFITFEPK